MATGIVIAMTGAAAVLSLSVIAAAAQAVSQVAPVAGNPSFEPSGAAEDSLDDGPLPSARLHGLIRAHRSYFETCGGRGRRVLQGGSRSWPPQGPRVAVRLGVSFRTPNDDVGLRVAAERAGACTDCTAGPVLAAAVPARLSCGRWNTEELLARQLIMLDAM